MLLKFLSLILLFLLPIGSLAWANDLASHATAWKHSLENKVLPYWYNTTQDLEFGGYLLADDGMGNGEAKEKMIVSQARMIWTFSHVHVHGFSNSKYNYLKAAEQGYQFLVSHLYDEKHGGYYWSSDLEGKVISDRKVLYGEVFVIYSLVEFYRASGSSEALDKALELFRTIQERAYDSKHGGWLEHFERNWQPIMSQESGAPVEVPGLKSGNAHLHLMEALSELYQETGDNQVKQALTESLKLNRDYFYPSDPALSAFHRHRDWKWVAGERSAGISYGHNVEFAWLMIRAQEVLKVPTDWAHFYAHLDHSLENGYDHERGGLYYFGMGNEPATRTEKIWWVEAEMVAALSDSLRYKSNERHKEALDKLIHFVDQYQADPSNGIWHETVAADGSPVKISKAHMWKAAYHHVRGMVKFIESFEN